MIPAPSSPASVYLVASSHPATLQAMLADAVAALPRKPIRIAVSYAATGGASAGRMPHFLAQSAPGAVVERFSVAGERDAAPSEARAIVERADLVFLGGGDPVEGARLFARAGADAWLRAAHARGAPCMGVSAGAMMLAAWWASWPEHPAPDAPHDGGELVRCAGVTPDLVVDCHAEEDHWNELRVVRAMLESRHREDLSGTVPLPPLRFLGLPSGTGAIVRPDGTYRSVGGDVVTL